MRRPAIDFYYEFSSPYSYLAATRIGALAERAGVHVEWKPFMLGPIFAELGYSSSPFVDVPLKGNHMWRDVERLAVHYGLPDFVKPDPFPVNTLLAARVALHLNDASRPGFTVAAYKAMFAKGCDLSDRTVVQRVLAGLGHYCDHVMEAAELPANKEALKAQTQAARAAGVFGAPSFVAQDGELFWGNDRLEMALAHAVEAAGLPEASKAS
ncbi:2-hydroxychromene-2-carboxylate isomerase [Azorhizobium oxalatiphilum]|uniref:2-hydroxychromene-2-carboxylate isomerase n=1 Tax=Azorhizobium oxalatiphilum TaxID=980631 RepID=A0A917BJV6_9HYPH|nr:2-hydroxychromene-2-carboxylate isomerase [Azorhizobium oxalatiphilum]GGF48656.1 2-hydroxychromene-2-carboxylate isomerase [Azorhizobium oxalatiphilum]